MRLRDVGILEMPQSYSSMNDEEMTYIEGGANLGMRTEFLDRDFCTRLGNNLIIVCGWKNVTADQLAKEIHGHAVVYYYPTLVAVTSILPDGKGNSLYSHVQNGVDIEDKVDKYQFAWNALWLV